MFKSHFVDGEKLYRIGQRDTVGLAVAIDGRQGLELDREGVRLLVELEAHARPVADGPPVL